MLAHTSDVHLTDSPEYSANSMRQLRRVIAAAENARADVLLFAGDTFDHNRVSLSFVEDVAALLTGSKLRVALLPGNHDPLTDEGVQRWSILRAPNLQVIGLECDTLVFPELELEIWGRAHVDYRDMDPLRGVPDRAWRWQVVAAHGHFHGRRPAPPPPHAAWLIFDEDIEATRADYVALGHWNISQRVGSSLVPAYYSGSPDLANSVNVTTFSYSGAHVRQEPLDGC